MNKLTYSILVSTIAIISFFVGKFSPDVPKNNETKFILPEEFNLIDSGEFLFVKEIYRNTENRRNIDSIEFGFVTDPYIYIPHPYLGRVKIDYMRREIYLLREKRVITGFKDDIALFNWLSYNFSPISDYGTK
jgi:hypothetical protein